MDVNLSDMGNGRFQIMGRMADASNKVLAVSATATGTLDESLALNVDGGGELTLRTEKDDAGEEFMLGKITLLGLSDDESLGCSLEENQ